MKTLERNALNCVAKCNEDLCKEIGVNEIVCNINYIDDDFVKLENNKTSIIVDGQKFERKVYHCPYRGNYINFKGYIISYYNFKVA